MSAGSDRVNGMMPNSGTLRSIFDVFESMLALVRVVWVNVTRLLTS